MPTQEERLTTLEQTVATLKNETAAYIQATDENITIMLGVIRHQGQDIRRIFQHLESMDEHLGIIDGHLGTINERLGTIEERQGTMDKRLNSIEQHLNRLETKSDEQTTLLTQILARLPKTP